MLAGGRAPIPSARGAVSSAGRAPALQAGGHWFEPSTAHLWNRPQGRDFFRDLVGGSAGHATWKRVGSHCGLKSLAGMRRGVQVICVGSPDELGLVRSRKEVLQRAIPLRLPVVEARSGDGLDGRRRIGLNPAEGDVGTARTPPRTAAAAAYPWPDEGQNTSFGDLRATWSSGTRRTSCDEPLELLARALLSAVPDELVELITSTG
jgi:hypothetical protein